MKTKECRQRNWKSISMISFGPSIELRSVCTCFGVIKYHLFSVSLHARTLDAMLHGLAVHGRWGSWSFFSLEMKHKKFVYSCDSLTGIFFDNSNENAWNLFSAKNLQPVLLKLDTCGEIIPGYTELKPTPQITIVEMWLPVSGLLRHISASVHFQ